MSELKLYMVMLGCRPDGRYTEQHDIFFGIGKSLGDLKPAIRSYWKEAPTIHIDAWREVNLVDGYHIIVHEKRLPDKNQQLFFINLGGYKENEFDEFHYKLLVVAENSGKAIKVSKETAFFRNTGFEGAVSHVDDKYGVDVDDVFKIEEILSGQYKDQYSLGITKASEIPEDPMHLGYLKWEKI
jgi:hypothetical protein